jgi:4'-phosphopantetheinyl transferase
MHLIDHWIEPETLPELPSPGELHLWKMDLNMHPDMHREMLSNDEIERSGKIRLPESRIGFINARGGMRRILSGYLRVPATELRFRYGENGKPSIDSPGHPVHFNLSHSGAMAMLAVAGQPVGVDVEPLMERRSVQGIARRVFTPDQLDHLAGLQGTEYQQQFLCLWTDLEARVKALGEGVFTRTAAIDDLESLNFRPQERWIAAMATSGGLPSVETWRCYLLNSAANKRK